MSTEAKGSRMGEDGGILLCELISCEDGSLRRCSIHADGLTTSGSRTPQWIDSETTDVCGGC